jgi:hypothetical protein
MKTMHISMDFLIIGAQKSASTFVHECLREHPAIFIPKDEVPFFEDPFYDSNNIAETIGKELSGRRCATCVGIKRPNYLGETPCVERIQRHVADPKFVVVLREPVERAISAYFWYMRMGYLPVKPLDEGMAALLSGAFAAEYPTAQKILEYGFYARHLKRYFELFPREKFLILFREDFKARALELVQDAYRFLGVAADYEPRSLSRRPKPSLYALPRITWSRWRNPWIHKYVFSDGNPVNFLPRRHPGVLPLKGFFYMVDRLLLARLYPNTRPKLRADLRAQLADVYRADLEDLEVLLERDLSRWKL